MRNDLIGMAGMLALVPASAFAQATVPAQPPAVTPPAAAPVQAALAVGTPVHDSAGQPVGTIDSITPQAVVINTGANKIGLPATAIGSDGKGGFVSSLTKEQLDIAYQQQQAQAVAQLKAKLVSGAKVVSADGTALGTVKSADARYVTLTTPKGEIKLPATVFTLDAGGNVAAQMTAAQFQAAISQVTPATAK